RRKVGGMIQVAGVRFRYDPARERGKRVGTITLRQQELEAGATCQVVTNSMLAGGGHNQQVLGEGREQQEHGSQFQAIKAWFNRHSPVRTPEPGRIEKESPQTTED